MDLKRGALIALFIPFLTSCEALRERARVNAEVAAVREAVRAHLSHPHVTVVLIIGNTGYMEVQILNTPLRDLPRVERIAKALQIARLAYTTYASRSTLKEIDVVFVVKKENTFTEEHGELHNRFAVSELGAPSADRSPAPAKK
jgi:hypothetical protein